MLRGRMAAIQPRFGAPKRWPELLPCQSPTQHDKRDFSGNVLLQSANMNAPAVAKPYSQGQWSAQARTSMASPWRLRLSVGT